MTMAIEAHKHSIAHAMAGNKEGWLGLFCEDAIVRDPVGPSPHDPEGKGFEGSERLAGFFDMMIAPGNLTIVPHKYYPCGENICAVAMTATNTMEVKTYIEMVAVYETNDTGKLRSINVYWDSKALFERLAEQMNNG